MSLLTTVQRFCERTNLPSPATVIGTTDTQVLQVKALLEEIGIDAASRHTWTSMTFQVLHTTIAAQDQGAMTSIAGGGWGFVKNMTIWDRTTTLPVLGPMDSVEWQALLAVLVTGPRFQFRIQNGHLLVNPVPPAGDTWAFEYVTKYWILGADGTTYKQYFTLDTDTMLIPEELLLQGLRAWWKREKGLDYAEDMRMYETQLKDASSRDGGKPNLHLDEAGFKGPQPGIWVTPYSWPL